jgi:hypothetical protein
MRGIVQKPTGKKDVKVELNGKYDIKWNSVDSQVKFFGIWRIT